MQSIDAFRRLLDGFGTEAMRDRLSEASPVIDLVIDLRPMRVRLVAPDALHLSAPIFLGAEPDPMQPTFAVARFNADHLFRGGYCLTVDAHNGSVRLEQRVALDRFDAQGFAAHLVDFAARIAPCARWYEEQRAGTARAVHDSEGRIDA
jgi:hypothetical protein